MATERDLATETLKAAADYSAKQYYAMAQTTEDTATLCSGATDLVYGILQNKPAAAGRAAAVRTDGITKWVSDGSGTAIVVGDFVGTDASGKCVKKATADDLVRGIAKNPSTADGTIIAVKLIHLRVHA